MPSKNKLDEIPGFLIRAKKDAIETCMNALMAIDPTEFMGFALQIGRLDKSTGKPIMSVISKGNYPPQKEIALFIIKSFMQEMTEKYIEMVGEQ